MYQKPRTWLHSVVAAGFVLASYSLGNVAAAEGTKADTAPSQNAPANKSAKNTSAKSSPSRAIAEARCDQEMRCGNVGTGKTYATRAECTAQIRNKLQKDLNALECPGGYDQKELNECLEEVRNENCMNPFDTLGRVVSCRSGDICKATDAGAPSTKNANPSNTQNMNDTY